MLVNIHFIQQWRYICVHVYTLEFPVWICVTINIDIKIILLYIHIPFGIYVYYILPFVLLTLFPLILISMRFHPLHSLHPSNILSTFSQLKLSIFYYTHFYIAICESRAAPSSIFYTLGHLFMTNTCLTYCPRASFRKLFEVIFWSIFLSPLCQYIAFVYNFHSLSPGPFSDHPVVA